MIRKLIRIIQKDFKLLLRSKSSALIVILGPLLLISLVGLAFSNTKPYSIGVSVYSPDYTNLTTSLLEKLDESQFTITKFDTEEACVNEVKFGNSNICVIFPPGLDIESKVSNNITFYVDYSKINLVWMVLDVISSRIQAKSSEISMDLTTDLLERLKYTEAEMDKNVPLIVDAASKNEDMAKRVNTIYGNLNALDLSMKVEDFKLNYLEGKIESLKKSGDGAVTESKSLISRIRADMDDLNLTSSQEDALEDILVESETKISSISSALSTLYSGNGTVGISTLISDLNKNLKTVESKMNAASSTRSNVNSNIDGIKDSLKKSLDRLNSLQTSLNGVNQQISSLKITNATKIVNPITTTIKPVTTKKTHFNLLFPTLVVLIVMITGVLLGSTLIIVEKKSKSFFRNYITPTHDIVFTIGTYLTALIIMVLQTIIFISISNYFFKTDVLSSMHITSMIIFFVITFFIFLGMLIGSLFQSEETTTLAAITICSILLFFSSTILPLESMPSYFRNLAAFNPFVVSENLLRQSLFFKFSFSVIQHDLVTLGLSIVAVIGLTIIIQKLLKIQILFGIHKEDKLTTRKKAEELALEEKRKEDRKASEEKIDLLKKELEKI